MTGVRSSASLELSVLSLSTLTPNTAHCELPNLATVTVGENNVGTEISLRTFRRMDFVTTENYITARQMIEAAQTLRDVNSSHVVSLMTSIEKHCYDYRRRLLTVTFPSLAIDSAERPETIVQDGVVSEMLKEDCNDLLVHCQHIYAALQQITADVAAGWKLSPRRLRAVY